MTRYFIRLGNYAHRQEVMVRRPLIVLAVLGIILGHLFWWLVMVPLFAVFNAPAMALIAFVKGVLELPMLTANQAKSDFEDLRINFAGAADVWRYRKIDPTPSSETE